MAYQKVLAVESDGHRGRRVAGAQHGNLGVGRRIVDQYLILVLTQQVESVAHRISSDVYDFARHVHESAALFGLPVVDQDANRVR